MGKMIQAEGEGWARARRVCRGAEGEGEGRHRRRAGDFRCDDHIKRVADQYAAQGYKAFAPAMFDRIERNITLQYTDIQKASRTCSS